MLDKDLECTIVYVRCDSGYDDYHETHLIVTVYSEFVPSRLGRQNEDKAARARDWHLRCEVPCFIGREHCDVLSMQMDSDLMIYRTTLVRTLQVVTICRVDKSECRLIGGIVIPVVDRIRGSTAAYSLKCRFPRETGRSQAPRRQQVGSGSATAFPTGFVVEDVNTSCKIDTKKYSEPDISYLHIQTLDSYCSPERFFLRFLSIPAFVIDDLGGAELPEA
ncbi:hypothetical protein F511_10810 [Dorcoceras hygrometricum]|uniref:Uncharacterized protein n=1 Tax=Dorcoceras hygrometricum TaxID=472368 RepID=A0A2Z7C127_9LAMI|nr:hypothetical protein F511_10810 [Dorcoceras hygrometricum]